MKTLSSCAVLVFAGMILAGATGTYAQEKKSTEVLLASEDLKWQPMPGGPPDVMSVMYWGDSTKGAYAGLTKFPVGFKAPLHVHTNAMKIVVLKGGYTYNGKTYGPGSYLSIPAGQKHVSGGVDDSETIFFIEQTGKFDLVPVEASNPKK